MESPLIGRGLDLDQFASVALQHAATSARTPHDDIPLAQVNFDSLREIGQFSHTPEEARAPNPPAGVSPSLLNLSTASWFDEYTSDPRFVESQTELRNLLFTSAQSLAPTRAGTPEGQNLTISNSPTDISDGGCIKSVVTTGGRVIWLKNYLDEVAPWVSDNQR